MNPNTNSNYSAGELLKRAEKSDVYWEESAILDFTEEVLRRMEEIGVSKSELAARLHVEPAYISKLLGGGNNFTLKTMVRISRALDSKLRFHLQPKHAKAMWTDYMNAQPGLADEVMISIESPSEFSFNDQISFTSQATFHAAVATPA